MVHGYVYTMLDDRCTERTPVCAEDRTMVEELDYIEESFEIRYNWNDDIPF